MTITSNIHPGLTAWAASTAVALGVRRSNGGNAYQCVTAGTTASSGGPTTTGLLIQDGTAWWTYLSHIDYTSPSAWAAGISPLTLTQPVIGQMWNDGPWAPTLAAYAQALLIPATVVPSATNTLTLTAAPGESFCDTLHRSPIGSTALAYSATSGAAISFANAAGQSNYIEIASPYTTISRLQFLDPNATSQSTSIYFDATDTGAVFDSCIVDAYAQNGVGGFLAWGGPMTMRNCLVIDRQPSAGTGPLDAAAYGSSPASIVNCTFIGVNNPAGSVAYSNYSTSTSTVMINCASFGYPGGLVNCLGGQNTTVSNCVTDASALGLNAPIDGGGNVLGAAWASQFIGQTTDFRLKRGSSCINAGSAQPALVPGMCDIAGTSRTQGGAWDVGCWEYLVPIVYRRNLIRLRMHHDADPVDMARRDWRRLADHFRDGYLAGNRWI